MSSSLEYESLFIRRAANAHAKIRLFCLPFAGAGASIYNSWLAFMPAEIEIIAIQLPGREDRVFEQPFSRLRPLVRTVAQAIRPYLQIPFAFFGYCCGGLISYELTKELRHRFNTSPVNLFVASQPAPHLPYKFPPIHQLPATEFKQSVKEIEGTAEEVMVQDDMMELFLPALRADFTIHEQYTYQPGERLNCAIMTLSGTRDPRVNKNDMEEWAQHTSNSFSSHFFEGGHFFVEPNLKDVSNVIITSLLQ